ncbi:MAG: hypothetical protein KJ808_05895 [Acidobacteria bacterium]|nr:hypothetical protein [Acidobacteriota bacterium]MBU4307045.1 hypothetical protein [Acidobacteriota bacterium]MBU4405785.1 hypothetical protein [Acidobacteriota bacterium]MCG2810250.1 hypothetical protein [Candidatus Aminicenantes bacterium]
MDKKFKTIGVFIIVSAVIWGAVILASSYALKGTGCYGKIQNILAGGVISHMILIWGPLALLFKKKENKPEEKV